MRLIDADALIEHLNEYKTIYGVPMTDFDKQVIHYIVGHIKNIEPTAYDVEAVVAELENLPQYRFGVTMLTAEDYVKVADLRKVIEIAREEGEEHDDKLQESQ